MTGQDVKTGGTLYTIWRVYLAEVMGGQSKWSENDLIERQKAFYAGVAAGAAVAMEVSVKAAKSMNSGAGPTKQQAELIKKTSLCLSPVAVEEEQFLDMLDKRDAEIGGARMH